MANTLQSLPDGDQLGYLDQDEIFAKKPKWLTYPDTPLSEEINPTPGPDHVIIYLGHGYHTIVDKHVYLDVCQWTWSIASDNKSKLYVRRQSKRSEDHRYRTTIYLHRYIAGVVDPDIVVDHMNGNSLNNTMENFWVCSQGDNLQNLGQRRVKIGGTDSYRGVYKRKLSIRKKRSNKLVDSKKRWEAEIRFMGDRHWLGCFATDVEAARAYDKKLTELLPDTVPQMVIDNRLNFPIQLPNTSEVDDSGIPF